jgi:hypothetical protein
MRIGMHAYIHTCIHPCIHVGLLPIVHAKSNKTDILTYAYQYACMYACVHPCIHVIDPLPIVHAKSNKTYILTAKSNKIYTLTAKNNKTCIRTAKNIQDTHTDLCLSVSVKLSYMGTIVMPLHESAVGMHSPRASFDDAMCISSPCTRIPVRHACTHRP